MRNVVVHSPKMLNRILNTIKSEAAKDRFFGEVGISFDKYSHSFYLDKDIELAEVPTPVILYLETKDKNASKSQFEIYEKIDSEFPKIQKDLLDFLTDNVKGFGKEDINKRYRIESITIPVSGEADFNWEIDLINLEDGFTQIVVEFQELKPIHYSLQG